MPENARQELLELPDRPAAGVGERSASSSGRSTGGSASHDRCLVIRAAEQRRVTGRTKQRPAAAAAVNGDIFIYNVALLQL